MSEVRQYHTKAQDHLPESDILSLLDISLAFSKQGEIKEISEDVIANFCNGCDFFNGRSIPCKKVGGNDQARYAARGSCGWAEVDGVKTIKQAN